MTLEQVARKWEGRKESLRCCQSSAWAGETAPGVGPTNHLAAKTRPLTPTIPLMMPFILHLL